MVAIGKVSTEGIPGFLERVRTVVYRHEARRAVLFALAAIGGVAVVVPLLGQLFGGTRATALTVLGIGGLVAMGILAFAVVIGFIAPRRRYRADTELARWVGTRKKDVASDLLSSVELASAKLATQRNPATVAMVKAADALRSSIKAVESVAAPSPGESSVRVPTARPPRSSVLPAAKSPRNRWEQVMPVSRAAALMPTTQSRRKSRFLFVRPT